jgi:hypothetical protein
MLVRIIKDWIYPNIFRQTPGYSGIWDGFHFTEDNISECDLLIVLNTPSRKIAITLPIETRWLFSQESPIELYRWHLKSYKYFDRIFGFWESSLCENILHTQTALPWHINKSYDELSRLSLNDSIRFKKDGISWVTSNARDKEGHCLRMDFKDFLFQQNFKFDLFGRGVSVIDDKFDGIFPYKYSIAIENYSCNDYWTEKIADCFLSWTMPIYYGARNITKYFPPESMILIDPNNPQESLNIIKRAINDNFFEKSIPYIEEARNLILNKYQFFPWITRLIKDANIDFSKKERYYIPKNAPPKKSLFYKLKQKILYNG